MPTTMETGMVTPVTSDSYNNLLLDAGAFFVDLDLSSVTTATALRTAIAAAIGDATKCLGATRGGGTFVVEQETREREVDGVRYGFVGSTAVDSVNVRLTTTLLEMVPANLARALATGVIDTTTATKQIVTMNTRISSSNYISKLLWVGDLLDGRLCAIELDNALNTAGVNVTFSDKGEATIPVEFKAHQSNVTDFNTAPFRVYFFSDA